MARKRALVTGVTGQDGSYLAELLINKGYAVWGMVRRRSTPNIVNLGALESDRFTIANGDMTDPVSIRHIIQECRPHEVYNLAAMSFVANSWDQPLLTNDVNYLGFVRLLEACREVMGDDVRIYQASSSEMYGNQPDPQSENTPMRPRSPYGVSKLAAHRMARVYRESFGMFVSCGICFNHESPRRGTEFVTRKIAKAAAEIASGQRLNLLLGTLSAERDWGYAPDYVRAMWMMLQRSEPGDFVIATGVSHSVEEFLDVAFRDVLGLHWPSFVIQDEQYMRPAEVFKLRGDYSKAKDVLGWEPQHSFEELVETMVKHELKQIGHE